MTQMPFLRLLLLTFAFACEAPAGVSVLTQHNDLARTGANLREKILNVSNVNSQSFGLLFTRAVDGQIYTQPLIVSDLRLGGRGRRTLVIVATVNDTVYAFDAEEAGAEKPYWHVSLLGPGAVPPCAADMTGACGGDYSDFSGNCGIVGTPVIDAKTKTLYVVARSKESGSNFVQRLHALDVLTGRERPDSPVVIGASCPGHGDGNVGGRVSFDPLRANQRAALALVNRIVYIGWSSHCDWGPYHGWLLGYDAKTLEQKVVYNTTPDGANGGIWMSGQAPAADAEGNVYLTVGNGTVGTQADHSDPINRGESIIKLNPQGSTLQLQSWFTPRRWQDLENTDNDYGNSGALLIPGTRLAFSGSKEGKVYLVNRDRMGGLSQADADTNIVQSFQVSSPGSSYGLYGAPVWWDGPDGSYAYVWCKHDYLRQYKFDKAAGKFALPEYARNADPEAVAMPGGILSISADENKAGTGILWAAHPVHCDANHGVCPGVLRAFDAQNVRRELWNSDQAGTRDQAGGLAKFVAPTIANGKVYLATFTNQLKVYGLLPRN